MSISIARRPTPRDHNDPRLHHYVPIGGGTGCLVPLVALILLVAAWFTWNLDVAEAQTPSPFLFRVGSYWMQEGNSSGANVGVYWFETETAECYLTNRSAYASGNGISCLRRERS